MASRTAGTHARRARSDRKSTRLNSSHDQISYAVFCLKKKKGLDASLHRGRSVELDGLNLSRRVLNIQLSIRVGEEVDFLDNVRRCHPINYEDLSVSIG